MASSGAALRVCVIGGGSFGSAMARVAAEGAAVANTATPNRFAPTVGWWIRRRELCDEVNSQHTNRQYWPGSLPESLLASDDIASAAEGANICIVALPAAYLEPVIAPLRAALAPSCVIVSLIKSLKIEGGEIVPYTRHLSSQLPGCPVAALMGPNIYSEMAKGEFAEATVGVASPESRKILSELFETPSFHVKCVSDVELVDLCGCMKNTVTLSCGFAEGLGWGNNVRAAIIRRGLLEIGKFLSEFLPADREGRQEAREMLWEACGIGDLMLSCIGGRGRTLAAHFVKHGGTKTWDELEEDFMGGMKLPDVHNIQEVHRFLSGKGKLADYPLLAQTYAIAFAGSEPASILEPLRMD